LLGWRGNLLQFGRDPLGYTENVYRQFGEVAAMVQGGWAPLNSLLPDAAGSILAVGPAYNQQLFSNLEDYQVFLQMGIEGTPFARLGAGLLNMNGEKHRQQRRWIMPSFQKKRVEGYVPDIITLTQDVLDSWQPGQVRNLAHEMRLLTMRIAGKTLFGEDISTSVGGLGTLIDAWLRLNGTPAVMIFPYNLPFTPYWRFMRLSAQLDDAIRDLIQRKRAKEVMDKDVISQLIHTRDADGARMTEDELVGQANLLFLAGHETTANALTWTLLLLMQHPEVMADLYEEIQGKLHGVPPTPEQLGELPLLERVIKESMRLLPPVPLSSRTALKEVQLGPYQVPARTEIVLSIYHTHHHPDLYPEPERFAPDRWTQCEPSAYEYLPFGAGARMCAGMTFALLEIKVVLCLLFQRYRPEMLPKTHLDRHVNLTLSPKQGLSAVLRYQDREFARSRAEITGTLREMVDFSLPSGSPVVNVANIAPG
jgi:cytochrome P450